MSRRENVRIMSVLCHQAAFILGSFKRNTVASSSYK